MTQHQRARRPIESAAYWLPIKAVGYLSSAYPSQHEISLRSHSAIPPELKFTTGFDDVTASRAAAVQGQADAWQTAPLYSSAEHLISRNGKSIDAW